MPANQELLLPIHELTSVASLATTNPLLQVAHKQNGFFCPGQDRRQLVKDFIGRKNNQVNGRSNLGMTDSDIAALKKMDNENAWNIIAMQLQALLGIDNETVLAVMDGYSQSSMSLVYSIICGAIQFQGYTIVADRGTKQNLFYRKSDQSIYLDIQSQSLTLKAEQTGLEYQLNLPYHVRFKLVDKLGVKGFEYVGFIKIDRQVSEMMLGVVFPSFDQDINSPLLLQSVPLVGQLADKNIVSLNVPMKSPLVHDVCAYVKEHMLTIMTCALADKMEDFPERAKCQALCVSSSQSVVDEDIVFQFVLSGLAIVDQDGHELFGFQDSVIFNFMCQPMQAGDCSQLHLLGIRVGYRESIALLTQPSTLAEAKQYALMPVGVIEIKEEEQELLAPIFEQGYSDNLWNEIEQLKQQVAHDDNENAEQMKRELSATVESLFKGAVQLLEAHRESLQKRIDRLADRRLEKVGERVALADEKKAVTAILDELKKEYVTLPEKVQGLKEVYQENIGVIAKAKDKKSRELLRILGHFLLAIVTFSGTAIKRSNKLHTGRFWQTPRQVIKRQLTRNLSQLEKRNRLAQA